MISKPGGVIELYRRHARAWAHDRATSRLVEATWFEQFGSLLPVAGAVLDIGCGAGVPVARYLIEKGFEVTGVDAAPEMIAMCEAGFPSQKWHVADMQTLALERTFDGLLAWDSLFHLDHDDQRRTFPIFRRHAARRAALMFTSGPSYGEAVGTYRGDELYHASLDPSEYRSLLDENGFDVVAHVAEDPDCGRRTVWLAQLR